VATDWGLFLLAALVLAVSPGPAVLYIVTRSLSQGRAAGIVSCAGVAVGGLVHVAAATLGLSALLATSAAAFELVRYAGAAYLLWLGVRKLTARAAGAPQQAARLRSLARVFGDGVIVNLLNPKTALFFLAFLPQFVVPSRGHAALQFAQLGIALVALALCTDCLWSLVASGARSWLERHPGFVASERYVAGCAYLCLGLAAAAGSGRK